MPEEEKKKMDAERVKRYLMHPSEIEFDKEEEPKEKEKEPSHKH